ncbi:MAG TPA: MFS transporter, partial [Abditibacteriaceae bacterium]|nr:MFS transporter [Abditibacteriaceae bacterium]
LIAGLTSRLFWLTAALLPLLLQGAGNRTVLPLVVGCILLASACQAFYLPAFFSWVSDAVPSRLRGPFFARRMQVGTVVAIAATVLSGTIADRFPSQAVYCAVLAVTALAGLCEFLLFAPIREAKVRQSSTDRATLPEAGAGQLSVRAALRDIPLRRFLIFTSLMYMGYGSAGAFLWLHAMQYLGLSKTLTGLIFVCALVSQAWSSRFWGEVIKRYGTRPVLRLSAMGLVLIPIPWLIAPTVAAAGWVPWLLLSATMFVGGIVSGAYDLGNFNAISSLSLHIPRATVTALYSMVSDLSMVLASWGSGALALSLRDMKLEIGSFTVINYHVVFICSFLVRFIAAAFIAPTLHEPRATGTRATLKAIAAGAKAGILSRTDSMRSTHRA